MDEFRGLASVVKAWRALTPGEQSQIKDDFEPLANVLEMAHAYMTEVEHQASVNEVSPLPVSFDGRGRPHLRCNSTQAHASHGWSTGPVDAFWCPGRRMSVLQ